MEWRLENEPYAFHAIKEVECYFNDQEAKDSNQSRQLAKIPPPESIGRKIG